MDRPSVVLLGHGYWGKNIARNLHRLGALAGVYDPDADTRGRVKELYPGIRLYESVDQVVHDSTVQAVAIATPAETHAALAVSFMNAGKHVFVEKPMATKLDDGRRMVEASERNGVVLMVGHLLEYHPAVLRLTELIRSGELGKLQYVYSNRLNLGKFRREENILWSFAPHDIAVILRLVGEAPLEVLATGGAYLQPNVADTTVTNLLFDGGVRAHIFVSWLHPYKEQRLVVVGSKKMASFDDRAEPGQKLVLYDQGADWVEQTPVPRAGAPVTVDYNAAAEPLYDELAHYLDCIESGKRPVTDGENGLRVLQVLQAAQHSVQTGGRRVPLYATTRPVAVI